MEEIEIDSKASSSLNVLCAICSEYFKNTDIINGISKCGHVFHRQCLIRWLLRSSTCPQCRSRIHKRNIHRLFLNFSEPTPIDEVEEKPIDTYEWIYQDEDVTAEELLQYGFNMGLDKEGDPVFAARVYLEEDLLPCYYVPKRKGVVAAWNCKSHFLNENIEILHINNDNAEFKWVPAANGETPPNSLETGYCETGETLYTARALYNDQIIHGKVHLSHGCAYMPFEDKEVNNKNYEVLVRIPKSKE